MELQGIKLRVIIKMFLYIGICQSFLSGQLLSEYGIACMIQAAHNYNMIINQTFFYFLSVWIPRKSDVIVGFYKKSRLSAGSCQYNNKPSYLQTTAEISFLGSLEDSIILQYSQIFFIRDQYCAAACRQWQSISEDQNGWEILTRACKLMGNLVIIPYSAQCSSQWSISAEQTWQPGGANCPYYLSMTLLV